MHKIESVQEIGTRSPRCPLLTMNSVNLLTQLGERFRRGRGFGRTEAMRSLRERLTKVAGANVPVLIQGESGTGKDISRA